MSRLDLFIHFKKIYPNCSRKEIQDLIEAIKWDKYWLVCPNYKNAMYTVALTRANIPKENGFQARTTYLKRVVVVSEAARFSRKGRILMVIKLGSKYVAKSVISWSAFLRLINEDTNLIYNMLIEGKFPPFINDKNIKAIILKAHKQK
ncbi:MAG: hypothetical protein QXL52_03650 [Nitrososphaerales archaeon]